MKQRDSTIAHLLSDRQFSDSIKEKIARETFADPLTNSAGEFALSEESLEKFRGNLRLESVQSLMLEAIIRETGRPPILVQAGTFAIPSGLPSRIQQALTEAKPKLVKAIPSVGRLEVLNHPTHEYIGTAWMIADKVIATNRHVAAIIARRRGQAFVRLTNPLGQAYKSAVDFLAEHGNSKGMEIHVEDILYIEENQSFLPDVALLRVRNSPDLPPPLELAEKAPVFQDPVFIVGYPFSDDRNDFFLMERLFQGIYGVKRLSPGEVMGAETRLMTHDATTLGGNSGSAILDMQGRVAGLHFAGSFKERNFAIPADFLKKHLINKGWQSIFFRFEGAPADGETFPLETPRPGIEYFHGRKGYDPYFLGREFAIPVPGHGNHSVAVIDGTEDNLLNYTHFSIQMHAERRFALFTACNIDGEKARDIRRGRDVWHLDPRLARSFQAGEDLYAGNKLDRGHLVRRLDPAWGHNEQEITRAIEDTFFFSNCVPQHSGLNQRTWLGLEDYILGNAKKFDLKISVLTGPVLRSTDKEYRGFRIPEEYWKVVAIVNDETGRLSVTGYLLSQAHLMDDLEFIYGSYKTYQVPLRTIENRAGLSFEEIRSFDPLDLLETTAIFEIARASDIVL